MARALAESHERCVYCNKRLKRNTVLHLTAYGRTVAYDARRGRLWVVCDKCGRWNLTPLDTRSEAIEECQRVFDEAPVKDATGGVSRAAVPGLRLLRVGESAPQELALWRHCARFQRRNLAVQGFEYAFITLYVAVPGGLALWLGPSRAIPIIMGQLASPFLIRSVVGRRVVIRCRDDHGRLHDLRNRDLGTAMLVRDRESSGWCIRLYSAAAGPLRFVGNEALQVLRVALAAYIVTPDVLQDALRFLRDQKFASPADIYVALAEVETARPQPTRWLGSVRQRTILSLPLFQRVALEIVSTEELERPAALEEVRKHTSEWVTAEEIADISDNLLLSDEVIAKFKEIDGDRP